MWALYSFMQPLDIEKRRTYLSELMIDAQLILDESQISKHIVNHFQNRAGHVSSMRRNVPETETQMQLDKRGGMGTLNSFAQPLYIEKKLLICPS